MTTLLIPAVPFSSYTQPNRKRKADDMSGLAVCLDFSHVVVDTNCVLDHLAQIVAIAEDYHLNVVVPFIVVQELDGLKRRTDSTGSKARVAITAINDFLANVKSTSVRFLGQAVHQTEIFASNRAGFFATGSKSAIQPDDKVLDCALWYKRINRSQVKLLTKDVNLSIKARMNEIPCTTVLGLLQELPPIDATTKVFVPENKRQKISEGIIAQTPAPLLTPTIPNQLCDKITAKNKFAPVPVPLHQILPSIASYLSPGDLLRIGKTCRSCAVFVLSTQPSELINSIWLTNLMKTFSDFRMYLVPKNSKNYLAWYLKWRKEVGVQSEH